ncbi:MAG: MotE family protein [Parvularculaceae bacterium]
MTNRPLRSPRVRLAPVLVLTLVAVGGLKAAGLWVSFSAAGATQSPSSQDTQQAATTPPGDTARRLADQISARTAAIDAREAELDTRERVLEAAERRIDAAMQTLEQEKQAIAFAGDSRAKLRDDELGALSSAYERMKPRDAARIFEILDDDILLPVAAGMRTQALAGVLADMSAERAKALTIALANRESAPPAATPVQP